LKTVKTSQPFLRASITGPARDQLAVSLVAPDKPGRSQEYVELIFDDQRLPPLRREYRRELGAAPVVVYVAGCYAVLSVEELLAALGRPVRESLLPFGRQPEKAADIPEEPP
jgi:hypothetical protein